jgi:hypothetical protein
MIKKKKTTKEHFIRWAGLFAILAGILYISIQFFHPADQLSSVSTNLWIITAVITAAMSLFCLIGILGICLKQAEEAKWLGLIGWAAFSLFWVTSMNFSFTEAFVLPLLTEDASEFVEGMTGIFGGMQSKVDLGIFPILAPAAGLLYTGGGLILGIATFRAGVLPPMAGVLLSSSAVITLAAAVIPHPFDRLLAIPMGIALIWLGAALWSGDKRSNGEQLMI